MGVEKVDPHGGSSMNKGAYVKELHGSIQVWKIVKTLSERPTVGFSFYVFKKQWGDPRALGPSCKTDTVNYATSHLKVGANPPLNLLCFSWLVLHDFLHRYFKLRVGWYFVSVCIQFDAKVLNHSLTSTQFLIGRRFQQLMILLEKGWSWVEGGVEGSW